MIALLIFASALASVSAFFIDVPKIISDPINKIVFSNKCMEDLGCFYTGPPYFHPVHRPISLPPWDLKDMKTNFWLFTPQEKNDRYFLEPNGASLRRSTYDPKLPTKFLIHGYLTDLKEGDARYRMKDALLKEGDYNVIIVDWTNSNGRPYFQAVANARVVGAQVAQMIKFLQKEKGISPKSVHLIGHSLGSHISGWAGERIKGVGRISGLDPAGPYFYYGQDEVRLDTTDAEFVDIIHSNAGKIGVDGLGIIEPIGDVDFYPNGGEHQPECRPTLVNFTFAGIDITAVGDGEGLTSLMATSCDHNQANEYYIASIGNKNCTFVGTECKNYDNYEEGKCDSNQRAVMGYYAKRTPGLPEGRKYYLETTDSSPYCIPDSNGSSSKQKSG